MKNYPACKDLTWMCSIFITLVRKCVKGATPMHWTWFGANWWYMVSLKKVHRQQQKHENYPACKDFTWTCSIFITHMRKCVMGPTLKHWTWSGSNKLSVVTDGIPEKFTDNNKSLKNYPMCKDYTWTLSIFITHMHKWVMGAMPMQWTWSGSNILFVTDDIPEKVHRQQQNH